MKKREKPSISVWHALRVTLPLVWRIHPGLCLAHALMGAALACTIFFQTPLSKRLFDRITESASAGEKALGGLLAILAAYVTVQILDRIANATINYFWGYASGRINGRLQRLLNRKYGRMDARAFEDTKTLDDIQKASNGMYAASYLTLVIGNSVMFYGLYIVMMSWYLAALDPLLILAVLLVFVPVLVSQLLRVKVQMRYEDETAPLRRQYAYYESCITDRVCYKETRLLGGYGFFADLYYNVLLALQKKERKLFYKNQGIALLSNLFKFAGFAGVLVLMLHAVLDGRITVGSVAAVYTAVQGLQSIMSELIEMHFNNITRDLGKIGNFIRLLEYPERGGTVEKSGAPCEVELQNVSFSYPAADPAAEEKQAADGEAQAAQPGKVWAVQDVSLNIHPGETIAIVGENGSGKSTLVRLITGLYQPDRGRVTHGGVPTGDYSAGTLFRGTSGVFQNYQCYQMTLRENVSVSEPEASPDEARIGESCAAAGVETEGRSFPDGYDTMLSREFDGVDLSGGQWQRVAIARGLYRRNALIVLDEPTAAIDPLEEKRIYEQFAQTAKGRTTILVTHRLGSVRLADRIVMMQKGKLLQAGTHEELLRECEPYRALFHSQADLYLEPEASGGN